MIGLASASALADPTPPTLRLGTLWIDVEDLFEYTAANPRPSGIQRLAFELYRVLQKRLGADRRIRFVRLDPVRGTFSSVSWRSVANLFARLSDKAPASGKAPAFGNVLAGRGNRAATPSHQHNAESPTRYRARRLVHRLPQSFRRGMLDATRLQIAALSALAGLFVMVTQGIVSRMRKRTRSLVPNPSAGPEVESDEFARFVQPGDILLALGAPWANPDYAGLIEAARMKFGIEFGFLVYDIIPLRRPEWCDRGLVRIFRAWFMSVLPLADHIFAISKFSADDIVSFAETMSIPLRTSVTVIPIGTGFGPDELQPAPDPVGLPVPGSYVLMVSTIEARKNHILLFRVWRRLLEEFPADQVPTLLFAGRVGWLVADLMQQLENTDYLDRKIIVLSDLSDAELAAAYRGCLFTVFPSFYEGWGLPVTESLAFGKPCIASDRTSIPEAGGSFCQYFNPDDLTQAYQTISRIINNREALAVWEAEIQRDFRPTPWQAGAEAILAGVGMTVEARPGALALDPAKEPPPF